jgi:lipopolysaccharide/colanic/teichoic acid biosynthesis glycosyltransferase
MKKSLNILYVGTEMQSLKRLQQQEYFSLTVVNNNLKAVNHLHTANQKTDAIICNFNLSGNDGLFLFDWLRERAIYDATPFILLAQEFKSDVFKLALRKGVDDFFITSDILMKDLLGRIQFLYKFKKKEQPLVSSAQEEKTYRIPLSKRIFDIVVASSLLILLSPLLLFTILTIWLESKGKVYYISKRVGRKTFDFYKLRSMRTGSDDLLKSLAKEKNQYNNLSPSNNDYLDVPCPRCDKLRKGETCSPVMYVDTYQICDYWHNYKKDETVKNNSSFVKIVNDPRVTRVGKFIRNTSIDELPQLINVLKGEMSIVGNRPLPIYEAELLTEDTLSKRFLAPAGITGLWQVELRGKGGNMSETERIHLDNEYASHFSGDNFSFWYDIKLILRTIPALLQKGAV